jgi:Ca-activated chloride channel family protein
MAIGDRVINAQIFEKQKAEHLYQDALKKGKRVAKLDQSRPNVFQMKVGNVMPGDRITIDMYYTEMLSPTNGSYQFVAPGVVGPRFTGENTNTEKTIKQPYTGKGIANTLKYDVQVRINAGITIQNVSSTSHKINVTYPSKNSAEIFLSKSNVHPANRDFILDYNLRGDAISSGLLLYEHDNEKFFAYMMEPPKKVTQDQITPREYLFIVDVSGSMNGYPLEVSKDLMRNLLCNLHYDDTFNVQLFASSSTVYRELPVKATSQNIEAAISFLTNGQGGGGTQLLSALNVAYNLPRADQGSARSMVIITDGYVSVEKEAFQKIEQHLDKANVFTFGIGSSVNRFLIEGMAKAANSQSFIATTKEEAFNVASDFKEYIATPLLTQVSFKAKGFETYDVEPKTIPDIFAARPVVIFGKYKGEATGEIIITGYQGRKKVTQKFDVSEGTLSTENNALRYLWARKKIARLADYNTNFNDDVKDEVTYLGLAYNLATKYTSFVAVDERVVHPDGTIKSVTQPLPMPANVSNSAVGAEAEIKGKSIINKTYSLRFDGIELPTDDARKITIWFKANYGKTVAKHLGEHMEFTIKFGTDGTIIDVLTSNGTKWISNAEILKEFQGLHVKKAPTNIQFSVYAADATIGCCC